MLGQNKDRWPGFGEVVEAEVVQVGVFSLA